MKMFNPPHPGEILLEDILPDLNMNITHFATHLGYARESMSRILHAKAPISPTLAWRLEQAGISSARLWLALQAKYDLWQLEQAANQKNIAPLRPLVINKSSALVDGI